MLDADWVNCKGKVEQLHGLGPNPDFRLGDAEEWTMGVPVDMVDALAGSPGTRNHKRSGPSKVLNIAGLF